MSNAMTTKAETHEDIVKIEHIENFEQIIKCEKVQNSELEKYPQIEVKLTR
jgi:hypothetical protein